MQIRGWRNAAATQQHDAVCRPLCRNHSHTGINKGRPLQRCMPCFCALHAPAAQSRRLSTVKHAPVKSLSARLAPPTRPLVLRHKPY